MMNREHDDGFTAQDHTWVICAFRESPYLEECILSLLKQTVLSHLLMVTSTPCGYISDLSSKYGIELRVNTGEKGIGPDWNFVLRSVETKLITLAHQDDVYEPEYAESMLAVVNRVRNPILYFTGYGELRKGEKVLNNQLLRIKKLMLMPIRFFPGRIWARRLSLRFGNPVCCPSVTYRKTVMADMLFGSDLKSNVDWDMWERLSGIKGSFVYNTEPLMCHRIHEGSTTNEIIGQGSRGQEDLEMFRRFWPEGIARFLAKRYAGSDKSNQL